MSTTRASRSRVSSPFITSAKAALVETRNIRNENGSRTQTTLDGWREPPQPLRPSFADAGIERHGTVLNMAPLGTMPPAKLLKQVAAYQQSGEVVRRDLSSRRVMSNASTPVEPFSTPEPVGNPTQTQEGLDLKSDDGREVAQTPQPRPSIEDGGVRVETGLQSSVEEVFAVQRPTAETKMASVLDRPSRLHSASPVAPPATGPDGLIAINLALTDKVVEAAVQEAIDQRRWPTAYALCTLYEEKKSDPNFVRVIEAMYFKYATGAQEMEFDALLKARKREGRKDHTAEYYFNGDGSDPPAIPNEPTPVESIVSIFQALNGPAREYKTPYGDAPRSSSVMTDPLDTRRSSVNPITSSDSATPNKEAEVFSMISRSKSHLEVDSDLPNGMNGDNQENRRASSSSLSSVDEKLISEAARLGKISPGRPTSSPSLEAIRSFGVLGGGEQRKFVSPYASANNFQAAASSAEIHARNQTRPIILPPQPKPKPGPRIHTFAVTTSLPPPTKPSPSSITNNSSPISTTAAGDKALRHQSSGKAAKRSMAPAALLPETSNSSITSVTKKGSNPTSRNQKSVAAPPTEDTEKRTRLKRKAQEVTRRVEGQPSFERHKIQAEENETASEREGSIPVEPPPAKRQKIRITNNNIFTSTRSTRRQTNEEREESVTSSPTALTFQADGPPSRPVSRAGTPTNATRPSRKGGKPSGLRVKSSPMKKKGTSAGIPRASGDGNSPLNGTFQQEDNVDYCTACGGNGEVICCDGVGCTRSFHMRCVDPPMLEGAIASDDWFCNLCHIKKFGPSGEYNVAGPWAEIISQLEEKNPIAFHLPKKIREYFEDVKTGQDGEYEEVHHTKPAPPKVTKSKYGEIEDPKDRYFRKHDDKGVLIICHACHQTAEKPDREIIPCQYCDLNWHLDCIPGAPLARAPIDPNTMTMRRWKCPAHVDDLVASIPEMLAPAHRFRKIKGRSAYKPAITRGVPNMGNIEIENEPSDDEKMEAMTFHEAREFGRTLKLPEKGIILDFIQKVKSQPKRKYQPEFPEGVQKRRRLEDLNPIEQEAAVILNTLKLRAPTTGPQILIKPLIEHMPESVKNLLAQDAVDEILRGGKLTKVQRQSYQAVIATLTAILKADELLDSDGGAVDNAQAEGVNSTSLSNITSESGTHPSTSQLPINTTEEAPVDLIDSKDPEAGLYSVEEDIYGVSDDEGRVTIDGSVKAAGDGAANSQIEDPTTGIQPEELDSSAKVIDPANDPEVNTANDNLEVNDL